MHAAAQVVHFETEAIREPNAWVRGPNSTLDPRVRIVWSHEVPGDFHARFSARSRTYRYLLLDEPVAPAVLQGRVGWFHRPLAEAPMREALAALLGEHDFSAFRSSECQAKSPVKRLHQATLVRRGNLLDFTFRADAFLHHMVRNVVGALVYVGAGRQEPGWVAELLDAKDRTKAAPTFMPDGLYLAAIEYDSAFALPAFRPQPLLPTLP